MKKAFTIIELMIVLAILWILSTVALSTSKSFQKYEPDSLYYYLENQKWKFLNINSVNYKWKIPEKYRIIFQYMKKPYTEVYIDNKRLFYDQSSIYVSTIWLNWNKLGYGQKIIIENNYLTSDLKNRIKYYLYDIDWTIKDITNIFNELCILDFDKRKYCINKNLDIKLMD